MVLAFTGNKIPDRNCNEIFDFFTKKPESRLSQKQKENLLGTTTVWPYNKYYKIIGFSFSFNKK